MIILIIKNLKLYEYLFVFDFCIIKIYGFYNMWNLFINYFIYLN